MPQLEFVVDNQVLASIANGVASVTNEFYRPALDRIRLHIHQLYGRHVEYKARFLDPIDWRPRECNAAADHVANCVLSHGTDFDTLEVDGLVAGLTDGIGIQVFSDGGFADGVGAAAVVVSLVFAEEDSLRTRILGARGHLVRDAKSAFHTEVVALDLAIEILMACLPALSQRKRPRR